MKILDIRNEAWREPKEKGLNTQDRIYGTFYQTDKPPTTYSNDHEPHFEKTNPIFLKTISVHWCEFVANLKKQTQFTLWTNEDNHLYQKDIYHFQPGSKGKKTKPIKANSPGFARKFQARNPKQAEFTEAILKNKANF